MLDPREVSAAVVPGTLPATPPSAGERLLRARRAGVVVGEDARHRGLHDACCATSYANGIVSTRFTPRPKCGCSPIASRTNIRTFTARLDGELLGGVLVYETARVAHAQYIAAGARDASVGATDIVFDHLLTEVYRHKCFDFGISNERNGDLNAGLMRNKEGFGARAVVHDRYSLDLR